MKGRKRHGGRRANRGTTSRAKLLALLRWKYAGGPMRSWKASRVTKLAEAMLSQEPAQFRELREAIDAFLGLARTKP